MQLAKRRAKVCYPTLNILTNAILTAYWTNVGPPLFGQRLPVSDTHPYCQWWPNMCMLTAWVSILWRQSVYWRLQLVRELSGIQRPKLVRELSGIRRHQLVRELSGIRRHQLVRELSGIRRHQLVRELSGIQRHQLVRE